MLARLPLKALRLQAARVDALALAGLLQVAVGRYALQAHKIHSDDTPTRALDACKGKAHFGPIWAYVRDDRSWGDSAHPAVWFEF